MSLEKNIAPVFEALELPVPRRDDFYCNPFHSNPKRVLFLTGFGLVVTVTPLNKVVQGFHPHFLTSLFTKAAGKFQVDIKPGVACPVTFSEACDIYRMVKASGVRDNDAKANNFGFIPGAARFPVMIDLDADFIKFGSNWERLKTTVDALRASLSGEAFQSRPLQTGPSFQDEFYAPLKDLMSQAWPAHAARPDRDGVREFFRACAAFKDEGKLVSSWTARCFTDIPARNYARRMTGSVHTRDYPKEYREIRHPAFA